MTLPVWAFVASLLAALGVGYLAAAIGAAFRLKRYMQENDAKWAKAMASQPSAFGKRGDA